MKRIGLCLLVLLLVGGTITSAAEDEMMIIFSGESKDFIAPKGEWVDFRMMRSGESRTQTMVFKNTGNKSMDFYMSVNIQENISETKPDENMKYQVKVTSGKEKLLDEEVDRGDPRGDSKLGKEWKIDTLDQGEEKEVNLTLTLDGESGGHAYESQKGKIQIIFATQDHIKGEEVEEAVILRTNLDTRMPDSIAWSTVAALAVLLMASGIAVVILIINGDVLGRKGRE